MRWKLPPVPLRGDRRTRTRFAWLPVTLDDRTRVWLEWYVERQQWESFYEGGSGWYTIERRAMPWDEPL